MAERMTFIDDTGDRARICVQIHYRSYDISISSRLGLYPAYGVGGSAFFAGESGSLFDFEPSLEGIIAAKEFIDRREGPVT